VEFFDTGRLAKRDCSPSVEDLVEDLKEAGVHGFPVTSFDQTYLLQEVNRGGDMVSDGRVRSRNVMTGSVVFALLLSVQPAFGQTRPQLSEVFQSPVTIQITTGTGAGADIVEGVGQMTFDQPAGKANEFYAFEDGPPSEIITRYDLGKIFRFDPPECDVTEVTGTMPLFWGWIAQAKQGDAVVIDGVSYTTWVGPGLDPIQTVAATNDGSAPAYYEERTPERTVRITFLKWQTTFKEKPNLFNPPGPCSKK